VPVIAIIGGGASGTLTAIALLNQFAAAGRSRLRIILIDRYGRHGLGQAYATTNPVHLLNAPADQMSAIDGDAKHLIRWADEAGAEVAGFLPRPLYGRYLRETLAQAEALAAPQARVEALTAQVTSVRIGAGGRGVSLGLDRSQLDRSYPDRSYPDRLNADLAVLATGPLPSTLPFPAPDSDRVIVDPWAPGALDRVADGRPVIVVGTGLTALDLVLSVTGNHQGSTVAAISRHGLLPRPHRTWPASDQPVRLPAVDAITGQVRLTDLIRLVRAEALAAEGSWQEVMDALRPHVPKLWQALSPADQRVFLGRLARYWEIHRHRVPAVTEARIAELEKAGRLSLHQGTISSVTEREGDLVVQLGDGTELTGGWLINGTGPGNDAGRTADPLLADLLAAGLIRPDSLGLGIDADADGAVLSAAGLPSQVLFTLGSPLRGRWYETTAVPEIRAQAATLAALISSRLGL
jgi:uncharacterized NAD(P)/FAD-binding protein YdhS